MCLSDKGLCHVRHTGDCTLQGHSSANTTFMDLHPFMLWNRSCSPSRRTWLLFLLALNTSGPAGIIFLSSHICNMYGPPSQPRPGIWQMFWPPNHCPAQGHGHGNRHFPNPVPEDPQTVHISAPSQQLGRSKNMDSSDRI